MCEGKTSRSRPFFRRLAARSLLGACSVLAFVFSPPQSNAEVALGGDPTGLDTCDLEQFAEFAGSPGTAFAALIDPTLGITFGEKLVGQTNIPLGNTDVISGAPSLPLTIDTSIDVLVGVNIITFRTTIIDGLGSDGHPNATAIGDGSLTVLYAEDQRTIAFDLLGTNCGSLELQFFNRLGQLLDTVILEDIEDTTYVFTSDTWDIAAITFNATDAGGVGYDNFRFRAEPLQRDASCSAGGPYALGREGDVIAASLVADVPDDPDGTEWEYYWWTDCPDAYIEEESSPTPTLIVEPTSLCPIDCRVTLEVDDGVGPYTCTADVSIEGFAGPIITCPADAVVECDGYGNGAEFEPWAAGATAAVQEAEVVADFVETSPECGDTGLIEGTWEVFGTDAAECGLTTTCTATFAIVDTTAPALVVDPSPVVVVDEDCSGDEVVPLETPQATDTCDEGPSVSDDAPDVFPAGRSTMVTYTAADDCGNLATASRKVTVLHGAGVEATVVEAVVGSRGGRTTHLPLAGVLVGAYDSAPDGCARQYVGKGQGIPRRAYAAITAGCDPVNTAVTDQDGWAAMDLPPGQYLLIAQVDSDEDGAADRFPGRQAGRIVCGQWKVERQQLIVHPDEN